MLLVGIWHLTDILLEHQRRPTVIRLRYRMMDQKEKAMTGLAASQFADRSKPSFHLQEGTLQSKLYKQFTQSVSGSWRLRWLSLSATFAGKPSRRSTSAPTQSGRQSQRASRPLESFFTKQIKDSAKPLAITPPIQKQKRTKASVLDMLQRPTQ